MKALSIVTEFQFIGDITISFSLCVSSWWVVISSAAAG